MIINGNVIAADDGMVLTNGETYSTMVYLGIYDSAENWNEIPESEAPSETSPDSAIDEEATIEDYAEALAMMGVSV